MKCFNEPVKIYLYSYSLYVWNWLSATVVLMIHNIGYSERVYTSVTWFGVLERIYSCVTKPFWYWNLTLSSVIHFLCYSEDLCRFTFCTKLEVENEVTMILPWLMIISICFEELLLIKKRSHLSIFQLKNTWHRDC